MTSVPRSVSRLAPVILVGAGLACSNARAQNLLENGDFEEDLVTGAFTVVNSGSSFITGWGVAGQSGHGVDVVSVNATPQWAYSGRQAIDMAGSPGPGTLYQDVDVEPGELYTLTFAISSNNAAHIGALEVRFGGESYGVFDSPAQGAWELIQINGLAAPIGAPASTTRLELVGLVNGYQGALVDAVSLTPVPAPGACALLLAGGVMTTRRRR